MGRDPNHEQAFWRREHARRQGGLCAICSTPMQTGRRAVRRQDPDAASLDHIVPVNAGGADTFENTQAVHGRCNARKGNLLPIHQGEAAE